MLLSAYLCAIMYVEVVMKDKETNKVENYLNKEVTIIVEELFAKLRENNIEVQTGIFQAEMDCTIRNDGPVTIIIDSKVR